LNLFWRALFAWLVADGDMHLKNMALLKTAEPGDLAFRSVVMAPLYDTVTTRVFPALEHDRMALKLNGKDDRLRRADFTTLARTMGLSAESTNKAIDRLALAAPTAAAGVKLPRGITAPRTALDQLTAIVGIVGERAGGLRLPPSRKR
jgi:serine/threonine-protein kinase HipA